jgi:hypothetical protein
MQSYFHFRASVYRINPVTDRLPHDTCALQGTEIPGVMSGPEFAPLGL